MKLIDQAQLADLADQASASPRLRKNLNLHEHSQDPIQRMFMAFQPGTYVRPHRHPDRWEMTVVLNGSLRMVCFDDEGLVNEILTLGPADDLRAVEIPAGTWHTLVALAPDSLFVEVKHGPYLPLTEKDFGAWAPAEGAADAGAFETWARHCNEGDRWAV